LLKRYQQCEGRGQTQAELCRDQQVGILPTGTTRSTSSEGGGNAASENRAIGTTVRPGMSKYFPFIGRKRFRSRFFQIRCDDIGAH